MTTLVGQLGLLAGGAAAAAWALTYIVLQYARHTELMDHPNERSSHVRPTPRGGGLAIAIVVLTGASALAWVGAVPAHVAIAFVGGGAMVAGIGWWDDRHDVRASIRAGVHLAAAAWAVLWLGGLPSLRLATFELHLGSLGTILGVLAITWSTNAFNFMDGIDGLAGTEGAFVGIGGGLVLAQMGHPGLAALALTLGAACIGFLAWNWAPASIFMGDVGSGFVGFTIGCLAVASERAHAVSVPAWLILYGVFAFDATVTLVRRILRGERWQAAHRSHAYQRLAQSGWTHALVVVATIGANILLVLLAVAGERSHDLRSWSVAGAIGLLALLYGLVERRAPMRDPVSRTTDG